MKLQLTTSALAAAFATAALPAFAQGPLTGVSNPDPVEIKATDDSVATPVLTRRTQTIKPATGTPVPSSGGVAYGPYVPYTGPAVVGVRSNSNPGRVELPSDSADGQIVTSVPEREGELREGTLLKTRIRENLSTATTLPGARFSAEIMESVEKAGRVIIPVGSILEGQVTQVHGGRRITGAAALHLETRNVTLPDGTHYIVHAQLIDTSRSEFNVNDEGTLKRRDNRKENVAVVSLATGSGAVAGAMLGGGVGAVVGAGLGAGVSTVLWLKQDRQAALPKDVRLVFSLTTPMIITPLSSPLRTPLPTPVSSLPGYSGAAIGAAQ